MRSLLETQLGVRRALLAPDDDAASAASAAVAGISRPDRLGIYRNTMLGTLTRALALSFPAVRRLVGAEFFDAAARRFALAEPPASADLDGYGAGFATFLEHFEPAAALAYLADVAKLEWAVDTALHAADIDPLDPSALVGIEPDELDRLRFVVHPSVTMLSARHPADAIWRAVLGEDDAAMHALDTDAGPVWLRIERGAEGVEVTRLDADAWRFADAIVRGLPLATVLEGNPNVDASAALAEHLLCRRFVGLRHRKSEETPT